MLVVDMRIHQRLEGMCMYIQLIESFQSSEQWKNCHYFVHQIVIFDMPILLIIMLVILSMSLVLPPRETTVNTGMMATGPNERRFAGSTFRICV